VQLCLRTVLAVYMLEVGYLGLLVYDHRRDAHNFRCVVTEMWRDLWR
jgi:hypothetical protein